MGTANSRTAEAPIDVTIYTISSAPTKRVLIYIIL
jgi:hypothetical protein